MKNQNNVYVPLNSFTFERRNRYEDRITDYDVHSLRNMEYTEAELVERDDTMEVVEGIEKLIDHCGQMLAEKEWMLAYYDENGYLTKEAIEENNGEKEHEIEVFSFPSTLVKKEDLIRFQQNRGVFNSQSFFGNSKLDYNPDMLKELYASAYKGKAVVKMVVKPSTLFADHFNELCGDGIDARETYVYGIVDIEKLFAELQKRGITASLSTFHVTEEDERKIYERILRGERDVRFLDSEPLKNITFESFLQNNINTRLDGFLAASMTFGEYLRKRNKEVDNKQSLN